MTSPRYLIVDTSGDVRGTNDRDALPEPDNEYVWTIIDTLENTYSNEDVDDADVEDLEAETGDESSLTGVGGGGAKDPT